jgi:predicted O-linked N-acetylglucosamine transferase (SPINDLY family)
VTQRLANLGIAPERVQFTNRLTREQYMALYHQIDLTLDTFPYNGHTTSFDSLWMGVPLVSLYGDTAVSRAGLSILSNLGLPELATNDPNRFVEIAVDLVRALEALASMRAGLRELMAQSPLMDQKRYAANVERSFRVMWEQWCSA